MSLAADLHEDLVEMPSPAARFHPFDPALLDLGREHQSKAASPEANRLVTDADVALAEQIFDDPQREREPDIPYHCEPNDLVGLVNNLKGTRLIMHSRNPAPCPASSQLL